MYDLEGGWIWEIRPHKREFLMKNSTAQSRGIKMSIVECVTAVLLEKHALERAGIQIVRLKCNDI